MTQQQILSLLRRVGRQDLSISESTRLSVPQNQLLKPYLQEITDFADHCRGTAIPVLPYSSFKLFHETGDRRQFEDGDCGYFPRRGRLTAFGILAWLYGREEDLSELEDVIWAVCDEYTWSLPAHVKPEAFTTQLENDAYMVDLFAAETGGTLAELVYLLGDRIAPIVRKRIARLLDERIFKRVLEDEFGWMTATHNWAAVCAGSVGIAAIYAIDDDEYLSRVLARILPAFDSFLSGFAEDGSCLEGIGYWNYGFSYFVSFADLLLRRTAGEMDLFAHPRVPLIAAFQQKCYFPGGRTISFSDGDSRSTYMPGLTAYLSRKYEEVMIPPVCSCQMSYMDDHCHRWNNVFRNLIWANDSADDVPVRFQSCQLPSAQWFIGHSPNGAGIAAKAGHNDEPHNHNDVGSFQYYLNGEEMLSDLGSGEYTRQYFSDERYDFFVCGSQGHNVPMIDGCTQRAGTEACAKEVQLDGHGISMEIAAAYDLEALKSLKRCIAFDEQSGQTVLTDTFMLEGEHEVCERLITYGTITLDECCAVLCLNGQSLRIAFDPKALKPSITPVSYKAHLGVERNLFALDFKTMLQGTAAIELIIKPE